MEKPPTEVVEFLEQLRKFLRPTWHGYLRRIWRRLFPPRLTFPTDGIAHGDMVELSGTMIGKSTRRVVSKTGNTLTFDDGSTATM